MTIQSRVQGTASGEMQTPYIKNIGLYKVRQTETSEPNLVELQKEIDKINWNLSTTRYGIAIVPEVENLVVMPTCFCYNEQATCYDTNYNFQHLPDNAYQVVAGQYLLNTNDGSTAAIDNNYSGYIASAEDFYKGKLIRTQNG